MQYFTILKARYDLKFVEWAVKPPKPTASLAEEAAIRTSLILSDSDSVQIVNHCPSLPHSRSYSFSSSITDVVEVGIHILTFIAFTCSNRSV